MSTTPKIRVAIVGGGVGGLIAALTLSKLDKLEVTVYEAANQFGEIGLSIGMPWRPWRILQLLDLQKHLLPMLDEIPEMDKTVDTILYRKSDAPEGKDIFMCTSLVGYVRFRRSHFHGAFLAQLNERAKAFTSKRLVSYTEPADPNDPIELLFQDGTTATCDILIGADGIKSAVRASMYNAAADEALKEGRADDAEKLRYHVKARFSGVEVYRAVISAEKLRSYAPDHHALKCPTQFLGKEKHIMSYPILSEHSNVLNVGVYQCDFTREGDEYPEPWVADVTSEHLASLYPGWEPDVEALFKCITPVVSRWAICVVTLPFFNKSRAILLGDAHAMTNFQGAGAGQAIEDAYILDTILSHPAVNRSNITKALELYSQVRVPMSRHVLESSRRTGIDCALHDEEAAADLESLGKRMQEEMEWQWTWLPEDEKKKAWDLVEKTLGSGQA
ncbi:FAD/NAD-P-binding domain-containing protein [Mycena sanguinolenta]|uniref:FAD/NAD-P-binding domain-containing protein n=1 Tax=Mycena sanguinolenta TaxID=230812 RepID=A0A8H7CXJ6_9AGAR|nr:FAD/NAD-P-binding domain-containing protein [Mycena sanguinolenta]